MHYCINIAVYLTLLNSGVTLQDIVVYNVVKAKSLLKC